MAWWAVLLSSLATFLLSSSVNGQPTIPERVPDCAGQVDFNFDTFESGNVPTCFCQRDKDPELADSPAVFYEISCLWGTDAVDLAKAIESLAKADARLSKIHASSLAVDKDGIPVNFFDVLGLAPSEINIDRCLNRLLFNPDAFTGAEFTLQRLNISKCPLEHVPVAFRQLKAVREIQLRECQLSEIPPRAFAGMDSLEAVDLTYNGLTKIDEEAFVELPNLRSLILGPGNRLGSGVVGALNAVPSLRTVWMPFGRIKELVPGSLANLSSLRELMLPRNHIEVLEVGTFAGLASLRELDLRVNLLHDIEPGVFSPLVSLRKLYLDANYIADLGPVTFVGLEGLTELGLAFNEMEILLEKSFVEMPKLERLDLHHNAKLGIIQPGAFAGLENLKLLNLSGAGVREYQLGTFDSLLSLEVLDLSRSPLEKFTSDDFFNLKNLKELHIRGTQLKTLSAQAFSAINLQLLDISGNPFNCDEELVELIYWIQKGYREAIYRGSKVRLARVVETKCAGPASVAGTPVAWLDLGSLFRDY